MFLPHYMARTMYLRNKLQTLNKGFMSINKFVVKMKCITDSLIASEQANTEYDLVSYILSSVGQEFDLVVVIVTSKKGEIIFQEAPFLSFEFILEQFASASSILPNA
ncbi:hypothetical protein Ddye_025720 [Dipteronia dyeriana]|uniref:Uncharacterized protein n=1 Tax=Dipteronia dyeriana TaxID=168575 RepID=A0AAD9TKT9_9ROSI|nr:hypothetical protein Ddye_025720 [Dipteronia dyeriana]